MPGLILKILIILLIITIKPVIIVIVLDIIIYLLMNQITALYPGFKVFGLLSVIKLSGE